MSRRSAIWSALFLVLSLLCFFWQQKSQDFVPAENTSQLAPDYIASGLRSRVFGSDGLLDSDIQATKMEAFRYGNTRRFTEPRIYVRDQQGSGPWRIRADTGILTGKDLAELDGNVEARAEASNRSPLQKITTEYLVMDLKKNTMDTDRALVASGPQFQLKGVGMHADINAQTVTILKQVEAVYDVKPAP